MAEFFVSVEIKGTAGTKTTYVKNETKTTNPQEVADLLCDSAAGAGIAIKNTLVDQLSSKKTTADNIEILRQICKAQGITDIKIMADYHNSYYNDPPCHA
jgi:hypothetical protein